MSLREEKLRELFSSEGKPMALEGVSVVEISDTNFAAQIASSILAELGAHVVKVEPPEGDPARYVTPYGVTVEGVGIPYYIENRYKEVVRVDLREHGKISSIVEKADVVVDGMRPGLLDSLGLGYRQLSEKNPRLIYVAISPYGHFGDFAERNANIPDSDLTAQAYNGYPSIIGNPYLTDEAHSYPLRAGVWAATVMAGVQAALSAILALYWREVSGEGQFIDVATHEVLSAVHIVPYVVGFFFEKPRTKYGLIDYIIYPFGYYRTADGYVAIATPTDADFRALLKVLKLWSIEPDWRYGIDRIADDIERIKELDDIMRSVVSRYRTRELIRKVIKRGYLTRILARVIPPLRRLERHLGSPVVVELHPIERIVQERHWYIRNFLQIKKISNKNIVLPLSPFKFSNVRTRA